MKKLKLAMTGIALLLAAGVNTAYANTMTLTITSGTFLSGGTLSGTFDYNTVTNTYSNWNITVNLTAPPAGSANPYTYTTINSVIDNGVTITPYPTSASRVAFYTALAGASYRELNFKLASALTTITGNGQSVNLIATNPGPSADTFFDGVGQTTVSTLNGGVLTVSNFVPSAPVPEPAVLGLMGIGLLGFAARKKELTAA